MGPKTARPPHVDDVLPARADVTGTHRRLLEVALRTFGDRGFNGVSVRDLAQGANIHPSSMYAHLASKEALLMELMIFGHDEHLDRVRTAVADAQGGAVSRMRAYVDAHVGFHLDFPLLARVANRELHALGPDSAAQVLDLRHEAEGLMVTIIKEGIAEGCFQAPEPWLAAAMIGGMGIRVSEWWDPGGPYTKGRVRQIYTDGALRILGVVDP